MRRRPGYLLDNRGDWQPAVTALKMTKPQVRGLLTCGYRGGQGRGRTADLPIFSRTLVPTELPGLA